MAVIFLSIITLGIYDLFWLAKIRKELNAKTNVHVPSIWLLLAPLLFFVIGFIVAAIVLSLNAEQTKEVAAAANAIVILMYLVAFLAVLPITFYWFFKFSKAVNRYTNKEMNTAVTFLLLWVLRFIGIAVLQDHFNDMLEAGNTPSSIAGGAPATQPWQAPTQQQPTGYSLAPQQPQEGGQPPYQQPPAVPPAV